MKWRVVSIQPHHGEGQFQPIGTRSKNLFLHDGARWIGLSLEVRSGEALALLASLVRESRTRDRQNRWSRSRGQGPFSPHSFPIAQRGRIETVHSCRIVRIPRV